jgi:hypothetical protein
MKPPVTAAGSGPPDRIRVIHHRTDELLEEQNNFSDGEVVSPVEEANIHAESVSSQLDYL